MSYSAEELHKNLVAIAAWAHSGSVKKSGEELIPNKDGTRLYYKGHFMGRVWSVYWNIMEFATHDSTRPKLIENIIGKVVSAFKEHYEIALTDDRKFRSETANLELKKRISNYYSLIQPFFKLRKEKLHENVQEVVGKIFEDIGPKKKLLSQRYVILESLTGVEFPSELMEKAINKDNNHLSREEEIQFEDYLKRIPKEVNVRFLHKLLRGFILNLGKEISNLKFLEYKLYNYGLRVLQQKDPKHCLWRDNLKGQEVLIGINTFVVGNKLGDEQSGEYYQDYEIVGDPSIVLRTGSNGASIGIDEHYKLERDLDYPTCIYRDPDGEYIIISKKNSTIEELVEACSKNINDNSNIYRLIDLIGSLGNSNPVQKDFTDSNLLRSYRKILEERTTNSVRIEDFINQCANRNQNLKKALMSGSGLSQMAWVKFYDAVMKSTLNNKIFGVFRSQIMCWQFNDELQNRGQIFANKLLTVRQTIKELLQGSYEITDFQKLERMINYSIIQHQIFLGSEIREDLVKLVCEDVVQSLELREHAKAKMN